MAQEPVKAVIFDYDDTLVKTYKAKWRQFQAVAKDSYGIELTEGVLREHWGKPYDEIHRIFFQNSDTLENMLQAKFAREQEFPVELQPAALQIIKRLRREGLVLGILSAASSLVVQPDLERVGFDLSDFTYIQTSDDTKVHKPDPAVFAPILKHLAGQGIEDGIIYVGDALRDFRAARDAGLEFIAITTGLDTAAEFRQAGVTRIIESLSELLLLL